MDRLNVKYANENDAVKKWKATVAVAFIEVLASWLLNGYA